MICPHCGFEFEERPVFARRLKLARQATGMTQGELAERVGLKSYNPITLYERGINDPSIKTLTALAQELKVSANWLLGLEGDDEMQNVRA